MKLALICMLLLTSADPSAQRRYFGKRNTPCSGKKGGISHCNKQNKFICQNGTVSQSKRICDPMMHPDPPKKNSGNPEESPPLINPEINLRSR